MTGCCAGGLIQRHTGFNAPLEKHTLYTYMYCHTDSNAAHRLTTSNAPTGITLGRYDATINNTPTTDTMNNEHVYSHKGRRKIKTIQVKLQIQKLAKNIKVQKK